MDPRTETPPRWQRRHGGSLIFPIVLIVAGLILLLNNLGIVPWSVWLSLAQLWPALLILLGIDLLLGRRHPGFGAAIAVTMLVLVVGVALVGTARAGNASTVEKTESVPLNGATSGTVVVNLGAGQLAISSLPSNSSNLLQLTAQLSSGASLPPPTTRVENGAETATIDIKGNAPNWGFLGSTSHGGADTTLLLNPRVPQTLRVNLGAGSGNLDLSSVPVHDLAVNLGAGQATIRFPASAGATTAQISGGAAGQLTLVIPPGVGAAIHTTDGLVNLKVSNRFQAVSDGYQTADYGTAANRVDITLHVGVGQIDVE